MIDSVQVGNKISALRRNANLSQEQLADKLFITRQALSKWETGISVPTLDMLVLLSRHLNATFDEILCLDETPMIDPDNIFAGHSRQFIIKKITSGALKVDLPNVLYQMSPSERLLILREIRDGKLEVDFQELESRLSLSEKKFLGGK
ncbi:MAG TPA: hypothetical protein DCX17_00780 [Firmicutes bacterium]|jgi:transcriptional regulator with XRE-family HTH domain|nr:hypothetical protein [Bacillota bacterium]